MSLKRRPSGRVTAVAALAALALLIAACGSAGSSRSNQTTTSSGSQNASASTTTIGTASGANGRYLTDGSGRALYLWVADGNGKSSCMGACAKEWPPLTAKGQPVASGVVKSGDLGTVKRLDGAMQVTYQGHPLYRFDEDSGPGKTEGQGSDDFGAKWWLVARSGKAITTAAKSSDGSDPAGAKDSAGSSSSGGGWN